MTLRRGNISDLVLSTFEARNTRRLTCGELRQSARIKRGLAVVLEALRSNGSVHYTLPDNGQLTDDVVVARCTTIASGGYYGLTVLAPDEAEPMRRGPVWRILVRGTPAHEGDEPAIYCAGHASAVLLCLAVESRLYNIVSSSVVDQTWPKIKTELELVYEAYRKRKLQVQ